MDNSEQIRQHAELYWVIEDQYNKLSSEVIKELHDYCENEILKIDSKYSWIPCKLNDFDLVKTVWKKHDLLLISSLNNNSKLFPGNLNLMFRTIHDYIHLSNNLEFDYEGEFKVWEIQSKDMSKEARQVLFSEIVLQACYYLYFDKFPTEQKIILI